MSETLFDQLGLQLAGTDKKGRASVELPHDRAVRIAREDNEATPYARQPRLIVGYGSFKVDAAECRSHGFVSRMTWAAHDSSTVHAELLCLAVTHGMGLPHDRCAWSIYTDRNGHSVGFVSAENERAISLIWADARTGNYPSYRPMKDPMASCTLQQVLSEVARLALLRAHGSHSDAVLMGLAFFNLLGVDPTQVEQVQRIASQDNPAFMTYYRRWGMDQETQR